jgi:DNA-binding CsgD family transcriptional regulator
MAMGGSEVSSTASLAQKLASCRNFTEICQLATTYPLTDASFSAAMFASLDADGRIRELGRYGMVGEGPSKESVALSGAGLIAQAIQQPTPVLIKDLLAAAKRNALTPKSDIDEIVRLNTFETAYVIPLFDQSRLYGVLGLLTQKPLQSQPEFLLDNDTFQALFGMAARAVAFRNLKKLVSEETPLANLTVREQKVLAHLAQDKSNQEIAGDLGVSVSTVKAAVSEILKKLDVDSRKQAGIKARYSKLS